MEQIVKVLEKLNELLTFFWEFAKNEKDNIKSKKANYLIYEVHASIESTTVACEFDIESREFRTEETAKGFIDNLRAEFPNVKIMLTMYKKEVLLNDFE